ncbi:MAG: PDDEXK nuclease domain-containing protein [Prolixibacteraceae bacterium]|nr:PDDEXK nuclease domain-containing protein [Prolixibacteraceae bacterium]
MDEGLNIPDFGNWIGELKSRIYEARRRIAFAINSQLLELYWEIGKSIAEKQEKANWGSNFIEQVAIELKHEFPDIKGFSRRNLYAISQWYKFYSEKYQFVPQTVAQIPWGHNRLIISKIKNIEEAEFYCNEILKTGWDRDTLEIQISNNLFEKVGKATNNFSETLPISQSTLVSQTLKDPYNFDFLGLHDDALEKAIEDELVKNITKFLLELGKGFAFLGRQYKIEISETDYFIDLLFYHLELRCYIVIELKAGKFKPEHAGKLNFYLSAVDSQLKRSDDNKSIGILLCRKKDRIEAEYTLRDINKPMGISEYRLTDSIPEHIKTKLPSIEELENKLTEKMDKVKDK